MRQQFVELDVKIDLEVINSPQEVYRNEIVVVLFLLDTLKELLRYGILDERRVFFENKEL